MHRVSRIALGAALGGLGAAVALRDGVGVQGVADLGPLVEAVCTAAGRVAPPVAAYVGAAALSGAWAAAVAPLPLAAALLLCAPVLSGLQAGHTAALLAGPTLGVLALWRSHPGAASTLASLAVAAISPGAAFGLLVAGALLSRQLMPVLAAVLLAAAGLDGGQGPPPLALLVPLTPGLTLGVVAVAGLVVAGGTCRWAGLAAAALALGPLHVLRADAWPLPAWAFAALGADAGWFGSAVVAVAALAWALAERPARWGQLALALLALEGLLSVARPVPVAPDRLPLTTRGLAEREGLVLVLPLSRAGSAESPRANLWRRIAGAAGRSLYQDGRPLHVDDPAFGDAGVIAFLSALNPDAGWLIPPNRAGDGLRGLGIPELVLDRGALSSAQLAVVDPLLASLYGAPQRDSGGGFDLWRTPTLGQARENPAPYFRTAESSGVQGWRSVDSLLTATPTRSLAAPR